MVRRDEKYTLDMFMSAMKQLGEESQGVAKLVDDKADITKEAKAAVDTVRNKAARVVAIGCLAGAKRTLIIATAKDELPETSGRAVRISEALGVLTNPDADEDAVTDIAESWAAGDFVKYPVRPLVLALRPPTDFTARVVGVFLAVWKVGQAEILEDAVKIAVEALQIAQTTFNASEGEQEDRLDDAVKAAKKWYGSQGKGEVEPEAETEPETGSLHERVVAEARKSRVA